MKRLKAISKPAYNLITKNLQLETLTYILGIINGETIPIFIDNGATHSLMHQQLAEDLHLTCLSFQDKMSISPIKGPAIPITEYVTTMVQIEPDFLLSITFRILEDGAVSALMGIQALQTFMSTINYSQESIGFEHNGEDIKTPLYSKQSLLQQEKLNEDKDKNNNDNTIFYSTALIDFQENMPNASTAYISLLDPRINQIVNDFENVFNEDQDSLPVIDSEPFRLTLTTDHPILRRYNRRYAPVEREKIATS
ncbi:hypothetical protein BB561_002079 [Smittium simulii]|uniref:Aspartic peptidase DDI1-type domain-containing protein n=1 Tax=Smittium simulii TaxID=133385 RepID=A0A2T9YRS9_9FUNG|nr:hypothetical protein BB561_002079 [Smittium simulii]